MIIATLVIGILVWLLWRARFSRGSKSSVDTRLEKFEKSELVESLTAFRNGDNRLEIAWACWRYCESSQANCNEFNKANGVDIFISVLTGSGHPQGLMYALQQALRPATADDLRLPLLGTLVAVSQWPEFRGMISGSGVLGIICAIVLAPVQNNPDPATTEGGAEDDKNTTNYTLASNEEPARRTESGDKENRDDKDINDEDEEEAPPMWVDMKALAIKSVEHLTVDHRDIIEAQKKEKPTIENQEKWKYRASEFTKLRDHVSQCGLWSKLCDMVDHPQERLRTAAINCLGSLWGPRGGARLGEKVRDFVSKLQVTDTHGIEALLNVITGQLKDKVVDVVNEKREELEDSLDNGSVALALSCVPVFLTLQWGVKAESMKRLLVLGQASEVSAAIAAGLQLLGDARPLLQQLLATKKEKVSLLLCTACGEHQRGAIKQCGACKAVYCSEQCQKRDWKKGHKEVCKTQVKEMI